MIKLIEHPIIKHKLTIIRNKNTPHNVFRRNLDEITRLMAFEVFKNLKVKEINISTPVAKTIGHEIADEIVILPILRAGMSMVDGMLQAYEKAKIGHIGLARDEETFRANHYYYKMPENSKLSKIFVVDPMLATGGSAYDTIKKLKEEGYEDITLVCIVTVKEGLEKIEKSFKDVDIYVAAIDLILTKNKYISPGLGDAGDRYCGTHE